MAGFDENIPRLRLRLKPGMPSRFLSIFQLGFLIRVPTGSTLLEMLDSAGFPREYVERNVQTIFVNGSAIDDFESAVVSGGAVVALSAAMPGLAGAILRKGSPFSALRSRTGVRDETDGFRGRTELVRLKLFNKVAEDMGPVLLQNGVIFSRPDIESFLSGRRELLHEAILEAELDGNPAVLSSILDGSLISSEQVLLCVSAFPADE